MHGQALKKGGILLLQIGEQKGLHLLVNSI